MKKCRFGIGLLLAAVMMWTCVAGGLPGRSRAETAGEIGAAGGDEVSGDAADAVGDAGGDEAVASGAAVQVQPGSWGAVDGLGRVLSGTGEVRTEQKDRFVGLFYWTWHCNFADSTTPRVAGEIVKQYPEAIRDFSHEAWEGTDSGTSYFWGEPLYGFYNTTDTFILRKHAELLADAGVDVIIFDCTNGTWTWDESYRRLLETFAQAREDGVKTPQIAFMLNFGPNKNTRVQLQNLYNRLYKKERYKDLWFMWDGKPLIMAYQDALIGVTDIDRDLATEIYDFFTYRNNEPGYFTDDFPIEANRWGWCSVYPQAKFGVREDGSVEQMTVAVAENATDTALVAMNSGEGVHGRAFSTGDYSYTFKRYGRKEMTVSSESENAMIYGIQFQQQWDYALSVDPDFIFVTGWNEWIAGRHESWQGTENAFPDQFNEEFSRDIEPARGILADHFYYQLVENIRRYKGLSAETPAAVKKTVDPAGGAAAWEDVPVSYDDYVDYTEGRDTDGYKGTHYVTEPVRNDILHCKFAHDKKNLYFMVQTKEELSPYTDPMWMRLLISVEGDDSAHWEGFDYIVNWENPTESESTVERFTGGNVWYTEPVGKVSYTVVGDTMTVTVPKKMLGLENSGYLPPIRFKWVDNAIDGYVGDILDLYEKGDAAPDFRFVYCVAEDGISMKTVILGVVLTVCIIGALAAIGYGTSVAARKKQERGDACAESAENPESAEAR